MKMRGEDEFLDALTDFIVTRVPLEVRREEPHLCRDLATALCEGDWCNRDRDVRRFTVRIVPLTERCGGMYVVHDALCDVNVAYFVLSWDADVYAADMNKKGHR